MSAKPLQQRPLDLLYVVYCSLHLLFSVTVDVLPFWPAFTTQVPVLKQMHGAFTAFAEDYTTKTNDPFKLATRGRVQRDWEFYSFRAFVWIELLFLIPAFIVGIRDLRQNSTRVYPVLLAYASAALAMTGTHVATILKAPRASDKTLDAVSKFYALNDSGRSLLVWGTAPYILVPAIMWVTNMPAKPLRKRPLDLLYVVYCSVHLFFSVTVDVLPLWPVFTTQVPVLRQIHGACTTFAEAYTIKTNDPFMLATRDRIHHGREPHYSFRVFMWIELLFLIPSFIIGIRGLRQDSTIVYPVLLAYASAALVMTGTYMATILKAPSTSDQMLDAGLKYYALNDRGRLLLILGTIPYILIPAIMWIDMFVRVRGLLAVARRAEEIRKSR
ncbi:SubName: Full=Uncharacterized protein {ECO:0000313/EMBL:CCA73638.1} [Serendipita indica DSM 11827]|nr:SubName: Full=Uncharacterized protein {ECO:0000313/EMBL:CCA73638.1} [Serendipita indica DSM 11827]